MLLISLTDKKWMNVCWENFQCSRLLRKSFAKACAELTYVIDDSRSMDKALPRFSEKLKLLRIANLLELINVFLKFKLLNNFKMYFNGFFKFKNGYSIFFNLSMHKHTASVSFCFPSSLKSISLLILVPSVLRLCFHNNFFVNFHSFVFKAHAHTPRQFVDVTRTAIFRLNESKFFTWREENENTGNISSCHGVLMLGQICLEEKQ